MFSCIITVYSVTTVVPNHRIGKVPFVILPGKCDSGHTLSISVFRVSSNITHLRNLAGCEGDSIRRDPNGDDIDPCTDVNNEYQPTYD